MEQGVRQLRSARTSASRQVYDQLKRDIITCHIAPGQALFEGQLAERMGTSKTPVREALGMLVQEGFVEVQSRQGYRVTDITLADVQEVFFIRLLVEPAAAELAAERATAEQLRELQELSQKTYIFGDPETYERFIAENRAFHVKLAEASGNRRLAATLRKLLEEMQRLFYLGLDLRDSAEEQVVEHRELLEALLKGNHHVAHEIAKRQVESSRKRVMEALLNSVGTSAASKAGEVVKLRPAAASRPADGR